MDVAMDKEEKRLNEPKEDLNSDRPSKELSRGLHSKRKAKSASSVGNISHNHLRFFDEERKKMCDYSFIKAIGQGSYGKVYLAHSSDSSEKVALKRMNFHQIDMKEINSEVDVLKRCKHKNIVQFIGHCMDDKYYYLIMEYCDGNSILTMIKVTKFMPERTIAYVSRESLLGLEYLHSKRMIHRDIKSANILTTSKGNIKLADFGVSAKITDTIAKRNSVIGSPYWMAPEVCNSSMGYSFPCDIWSTGISMIEMASGYPPGYDLLPVEILAKIGKSNYKPPKLKGDQWSHKFHNFIKTTLIINPNRRPTATELLRHEFLQGDDLSAQLMIEYFNHCDLLKKSLPQNSRNTTKGKQTKENSHKLRNINDFYSKEYNKLYKPATQPDSMGDIVKVKHIDMINSPIIDNFFKAIMQKSPNFAFECTNQLINNYISTPSKNMGALLLQITKGIYANTITCSASFIHPGLHDQYCIIGSDAGISIRKINQNDTEFYKFHNKMCHDLIIHENTLLSISGNNKRIFEHNLLLVINQMNNDKQKSSTLKSIALKFNEKISDFNFPQKMSIKVKAASYGLPDLSQIYKMKICKSISDPIVALYNDNFIIILLWHNIKKRFIISRKIEAPFFICHPVFEILVPPWSNSPLLCLNLHKRSLDNSIEMCYLDPWTCYINKNYAIQLDNNPDFEKLEVSCLKQINNYSFVLVDAELPDIVSFYDFQGNPLKNISGSLSVENNLVKSTKYPAPWIYPFKFSEISIEEPINSIFIYNDKICIFGRASFVAYSLYSGQKVQYFTEAKREYKLLFVDKYAVIVASDIKGSSRLFNERSIRPIASYESIVDAKSAITANQDDVSEELTQSQLESAQTNNNEFSDTYRRDITINMLIGL